MIVTVNKKALKFSIIYNANICGGQKTQLYSKVLLQRPWWRLTKSEHNANLTVAVSSLDEKVVSKKACVTCVYNVIPGMELLLNEQRLYDAFYATFKEKTYESLKLSYKLPSEMTKLLNHLHYGDLQKTNEAASFTFDSSLAGRFPEVQEQWIVEYEKKRAEAANARRASRKGERQKFAPNIVPPVNQDFEIHTKQEGVNDLIWGSNLAQTSPKSFQGSTNISSSQESNLRRSQTFSLFKSAVKPSKPHPKDENSTSHSTPQLTTSQLSSSHLPRLSTPQIGMKTQIRSTSSSLKTSVSKSVSRIETLPFAPKKEQKNDFPPQSLPPQYGVVDPQINQANMWEVVRDGVVKEVVYSMQNFVQYYGKSMRKFLRKSRWQVRKCCERRLILEEKPVLLRRHVLIRCGGDVFVYDEPLFQLEETEPDTAELEGASRLFTRYYDARLLSAPGTDFLVNQKFQTQNFFRHYIDGPSKQIILKTIQAQQQQLQRLTQWPGSFALLEYRFQIGGYTDGFPVRLEGITADIDMSPKSAATFVLFPAMLDDLFDLTIDQHMAEHAAECQKLLKCESSAEKYVRKLQNFKSEDDTTENNKNDTTKRITPEQFKEAGGQVGKLATLIADIPLDARRLDFLRFSGGREINQFKPIIVKWNPQEQ